MSVIVFAEIDNQKYKKSSFEAISYGKKLASEMGTECIALTLSNIDGTADLGIYGADRVVNLDAGGTFTADATTSKVAEACKQLNASVVILSNTYTGKSMSPGISVALGASVARNVISHPDLSNGFSVKRGVFSGKGFAHTSLKRSVKVLALTPNTFDLDNSGNAASIEELNIEEKSSKIEITKTDKKISNLKDIDRKKLRKASKADLSLSRASKSYEMIYKSLLKSKSLIVLIFQQIKW